MALLAAAQRLKIKSREKLRSSAQAPSKSALIFSALHCLPQKNGKSRLAERFENDFYASREGKTASNKTANNKSNVDELLKAVMADPEKLAMLTNLMALQSVQA